MNSDANNALFHCSRDSLETFLQGLSTNPALLPVQRAGVRELLRDPSFNYQGFSSLIPTVTKHDIFGNRSYIGDLVRSRANDGLKLIPAAGTRNDVLAFRVRKDHEEAAQFEGMAELVQSVWQADLKEFLILNAYPTGIHLPSTLNSIECSAKPEVVRLAFESLCSGFKRVILICQPHFLRFLVEQSFLKKKEFTSLYIVLGGSWFSRHYLSSLARQLDLPLEDLRRRTISLYGVAEAGLGIGIQTAALQEHRENSPLASKHGASRAVPMLFALDTARYYLEEVNGRLVISSFTSVNEIPILRYEIGDRGSLLPKNYTDRWSNDPNAFFFSLNGRGPDGPTPAFADEIEELMDSEPLFYRNLTGQFVIFPKEIWFEGREGLEKVDDLQKELKEKLNIATTITVTPKPRSHFQFRRDLVRKPQHYAP